MRHTQVPYPQIGNAVSTAVLVLLAVTPGYSQVNVLTANYDNFRSNSNLQETQLTPAAVLPGKFGKLGSFPVDGQVYGQPLYVSAVSIPGQGTHGVVYIATEHNSVYAYDAASAASPTLYWHVNLGPSVPSSVLSSDYTDVYPEIGILSTGVIDPTSGVLYEVAEILQNGAPVFQLHALDLATGAERMSGPVTIAASVSGTGYNSTNGTVSFQPSLHIQRPGLLLANGTVYIAFGSHADYGNWHGWVIGYSASNVKHQAGVYNATPNGMGASIWQSGRGLAADETGALYFITGNGDNDGASNFGESMVKISGTTFQLSDWYSPGNEEWLSDNDEDLAAGVGIFPGTHTAIAGDKFGDFYAVNGDAMGHLDTAGSSQWNVGNGNFGIFTFALWSRADGAYLYAQQQWGPVLEFQVTGASINPTPVATSNTTAVTGYGGFAISANGNQPQSGILWQITRDTQDSSRSATLHAYSAANLAELWNSNMAAADNLGTFPKFVSPTVANGFVYVPTFSGTVAVYGLLSPSSGGGQAVNPAIAGVSNAASYASVTVSPGELITIFGANIGPGTPAGLQLNPDGTVSTNLASTRVLFDGIAAPMIYAGNGQVSAVVPYELSNPTTQVQVEYQGAPSANFAMNVATATPGIFSMDSSGTGQAAALNQDGTVNSDANPAAAGSVVVFFATGSGQMTPAPADGSVVAAASLPLPVQTVKVNIGGKSATVLYAGGAPGMVAGVMQINVRIPAAVPAGDAPVVLRVGAQSSPQSITIAVK